MVLRIWAQSRVRAMSQIRWNASNYAEVLHSQPAMVEGDEPDVVVNALMELASTEASKFQSNKERDMFSKLLVLVYLPRLYGDHEQDINDAR